jgi:opacity protein-like surface antigen
MLHTHCRTIHTPPHHTRSCPPFPRCCPPYVTLVLPALLLCWLAVPAGASAQGLELAGGWAYITGNNGNGFNVGAGWYFTNHVQLAADYDTVWKDNIIGTFQLTSLGLVTSKTHLQNWLFGPRVFFYSRDVHKRRMNVFGEAQFGFSHTRTRLELVNMPSTSTTDNGFSWMLGGGAEYAITRHWAARGKLDLLRTHFANAGQSRLRLGIGLAYTFGTRER